MIRFRFRKDEGRYLRLVSEMYRDVAANLAPKLVSRVMRNFGKIEQLVFLEGVRQGLAIAEISNLSEQLGGPITVRDNKPFQAHALVYGSTDTPLSDIEQRWLDRLGADSRHGGEAWLEAQSMRFAPQTLEEALQEDAQSGEEPPEDREAARGAAAEQQPPWASEDTEGAHPLSEEEVRRIIHSESSDSESAPDPEPEARSGPEVESPAFLDRVRDRVQALQKSGHEFTSWHQLILALHVDMAVDASYLDLELTTDMGRAVLDQCGLYNLHSGAAIDLSEVQRAEDEKAADGRGPETDG